MAFNRMAPTALTHEFRLGFLGRSLLRLHFPPTHAPNAKGPRAVAVAIYTSGDLFVPDTLRTQYFSRLLTQARIADITYSLHLDHQWVYVGARDGMFSCKVEQPF